MPFPQTTTFQTYRWRVNNFFAQKPVLICIFVEQAPIHFDVPRVRIARRHNRAQYPDNCVRIVECILIFSCARKNGFQLNYIKNKTTSYITHEHKIRVALQTERPETLSNTCRHSPDAEMPPLSLDTVANTGRTETRPANNCKLAEWWNRFPCIALCL